MILAIVGSRDRHNAKRRAQVAKLVEQLDRAVVLVTGDCPTGVDGWVTGAALRDGRPCLVARAPWDVLGRRAGPVRNELIVAVADQMIALPDEAEDTPGSGTWSAIRLMRAAGKGCEVIHVH